MIYDWGYIIFPFSGLATIFFGKYITIKDEIRFQKSDLIGFGLPFLILILPFALNMLVGLEENFYQDISVWNVYLITNGLLCLIFLGFISYLKNNHTQNDLKKNK